MSKSAEQIKAEFRAKRHNQLKIDQKLQNRAPAPPRLTQASRLSQRSGEQNGAIAAPEVELAAIAALYQYPKQCFPVFNERARPEFFSNPVYRSMLAEISDYLESHPNPDLLLFLQHLLDSGRLKAFAGPALIGELATIVSVPENFPYHLDILRDKYVARQTAKLGADLASKVSVATEEQLWSVISEHQRAIADLRTLESSTAPKSPLTIRHFKELVEMTFDELDNYFGDRILAAGQPCTLIGPGGVGKSRLALQLAVCMITGRDFLGMRTRAKGKRWLFIQTENSNRRLHYDLKNMVAAFEFSEEEIEALEDCLLIHTLENESDSLVNLSQIEGYAAVNSLIHDTEPDFVQWDPLNSLTNADLNSDMDMRALVTTISSVTNNGRHDRVPLVLHHSLTGKLGAARAVGWDKSSYGRNSKVLQAWTRAQINLAPRSADDPSLLLLSCGKNNNGRLFPEIGLRFDEDLGIYVKDDSFDPEEFREEVGIAASRRKTVTVEDVIALCEDGIPKPKLVARIKEKFCIQPRAAYNAINRTEAAGLIKKDKGKNWNSTYSVVEQKGADHDHRL